MGNHLREPEATPIYSELRLDRAFVNYVDGIYIPEHPIRGDIDWGEFWLPTLGHRPVSLPNI